MKRLYLAASLALTACGSSATTTPPPDRKPHTPGPVRGSLKPVRQGHVPATNGDPAASPALVRRACFLSVDGKVEVQGACLVYPVGDGGYTLNVWSKGKPRQSHFAVVSADANGTAEASWNADPDDDRAGDLLGTVRLSGGCWINDRARICAR